MEYVGLGIGAFGLAVQVFDGVVKGYKFLVATVEMPEQCKKYREMLIIEYNHLLSWGKTARLLEVEENKKITLILGADPIEMINTLKRIEDLLLEFAQLNGKYAELRPYKDDKELKEAEDRAKDFDLQKVSGLALSYERTKPKRKHLLGTNHIIEAFKGLGTVAAHPKRIVWTLKDDGIFKALLRDLHYFNERLSQLMGEHDQKTIRETTKKTYLEMIQMRSGIAELKELKTAVQLLASTVAAGSGGARPDETGEILQDLVKLKSFTVSDSELEDADSLKPQDWTSKNLRFTRKPGELRTRGVFDPAGVKSGTSNVEIWIEWKRYIIEKIQPAPTVTVDPDEGIDMDEDEDEEELEATMPVTSAPRTQIHQGTLKRSAALAELLKMPKPADFCTPECLGFFDDAKIGTSRYFGLVFKMPAGSTKSSTPRTLFDVLDAEDRRPSLTQRVELASKLASCLLYFHAVNWLHKAVRSDNIVFMVDGSNNPHQHDPTAGGFDISKPILSGFEYSRPDSNHQTTQWMDKFEGRFEMYRHPDVQYLGPKDRNSSKTHDIYGLGLLLIEIAHWKPLYRLLAEVDGEKYGDLAAIDQEEAKEVRDVLLNRDGGGLAELEDIVGKRYHDVVRRCLVGYGEDGFGIEKEQDQRSPTVGFQLQESYLKNVVQQLKGLVL